MEDANPYEAPASRVDEDEFQDNVYADGGQLAGRGTRLGAKILDSMAVAVPAFFVAMAGPAFGDAGGVVAVGLMGLVVLGVLGINLYWLHENGQTIGKRVVDIKIVRSDRRTRVSLWRIILARWLPVAVLSSVPCIGSIFGLADPLLIFRDDRRCIHDHIADTTVVIDGTVPGETSRFDQRYLEEAEMETFDKEPAGSAEEGPPTTFDDANQEW